VSTRQIVAFAEQHIAPFGKWFNALPSNSLWTESSVRRRTIHDPTYDPQLMIALEQDAVPVGFLLANIANDIGWIRAFLVHPHLRRTGIGTVMFDTIEERLVQRGIKEVNAGWAQPNYFLPGVDINYTPAIVFLDQRGYQTSRETRVNMEVKIQGQDLSTRSTEDRLARQEINIRRAQPGDADAIRDFCVRHGAPDWAVETLQALETEPVTVFVALQQRQLCAFATHSVCGPVHFGPMLTDPELRGRGIGTVLLKRCLFDWQSAGVPRCEIVWAGPISFYARAVGATICKGFWTFQKTLDEST
jgi:GNAT superfamily N-acetyltransferase